MSKPTREELLKRVPSELRADGYVQRAAKSLGIQLSYEPVTETQFNRLKEILSKGEALSKIVIENRRGND